MSLQSVASKLKLHDICAPHCASKLNVSILQAYSCVTTKYVFRKMWYIQICFYSSIFVKLRLQLNSNKRRLTLCGCLAISLFPVLRLDE